MIEKIYEYVWEYWSGELNFSMRFYIFFSLQQIGIRDELIRVACVPRQRSYLFKYQYMDEGETSWEKDQ